MTGVYISVFILAVLQGLVIAYLWRYTRTRPLSHDIVGEVVAINVTHNDRGTVGTVEYVDLAQRFRKYTN